MLPQEIIRSKRDGKPLERLAEFAGPETRLHLCDNDGVVETVTMGEMLPYGFAGEMLK